MSTVADIEKAVHTYIETPETTYAIMVDGEWGTGKTYMWKTNLLPQLGPDEALYVSLYGLQTSSDIDNEIYKSLSIAGENAGGFLSGLLDKTGIDFDEVKLGGLGFAAQYGMKKWKETRLKKSKELFICFDDLERWAGDLNICLSYINKLVEHHGTKCLIIGNTSHLNERNELIFHTEADKVIKYKYALHHDPSDVFKAAFQLANFDNDKVKSLLVDIHHNNANRFNSLINSTNCHNIRIIATALTYASIIVSQHFSIFEASHASATEYIEILLASYIMTSMYCRSSQDKTVFLNPIPDIVNAIEKLKERHVSNIEDDDSRELEKRKISELYYRCFASNGTKPRGVMSIIQNGFYRQDDFLEEFNSWRSAEDYELYLDTFKAWYMKDDDADELYHNTYNSIFALKAIKNPNTLLFLAGRMTNDIKRGVIDFDFDTIKMQFRKLFEDLYASGEMERCELGDSIWSFQKCTYCMDLISEIRVKQQDYINTKNQYDLSCIWIDIKNNSTITNILDKCEYNISIFGNYHTVSDVISALEALDNGELFELTRWMGSQIELHSNLFPEIEKIEPLIVELSEKYSNQYGVKAGHIKQIIRILKDHDTAYDQCYLEAEASSET